MQQLNPGQTTWHLTFGTYGARLHGDGSLTVDRRHNHRGQAFIGRDTTRADYEQQLMRAPEVRLTLDQRLFIEAVIPAICQRGGWTFRICAAPRPPEDNHVHVLLDADPSRHGKDVRKWLKRWLSEALNERFGKPASGEWWAEDGSTKPVKQREYLNNAYGYIERQRTTRT